MGIGAIDDTARVVLRFGNNVDWDTRQGIQQWLRDAGFQIMFTKAAPPAFAFDVHLTISVSVDVATLAGIFLAYKLAEHKLRTVVTIEDGKRRPAYELPSGDPQKALSAAKRDAHEGADGLRKWNETADDWQPGGAYLIAEPLMEE